MADTISVSFSADAGDLTAALAEIDADLKATVASLGQIATASGTAATALDRLGQQGGAAGKNLNNAGKTVKSTKDIIEAAWKTAGSSIGTSFAQASSRVILGTETMQKAVRSFAQSAAADIAKAAEQSVIAWANSELTRTQATETGAAARSAAESQGQSTSLVTLIENVLKAIGIDAGKVFADVFAFFAPDMGPAAAGPAAAAAGTVMAAADFATAAVGMWEVPSDMPAFIHKGEAILPADYASGFRAAVAGGARGATPAASFSIQAMDGASVQRVLGANHGAVAAALKRAWRHGSGR